MIKITIFLAADSCGLYHYVLEHGKVCVMLPILFNFWHYMAAEPMKNFHSKIKLECLFIKVQRFNIQICKLIEDVGNTFERGKNFTLN